MLTALAAYAATLAAYRPIKVIQLVARGQMAREGPNVENKLSDLFSKCVKAVLCFTNVSCISNL